MGPLKAHKPSSTKKGGGYVLCTDAGEYRIDLHFGRVYRVAKPLPNDPAQMIRIIDESGEDYLYARDWFVAVDLPPKARRALAAQMA